MYLQVIFLNYPCFFVYLAFFSLRFIVRREPFYYRPTLTQTVEERYEDSTDSHTDDKKLQESAEKTPVDLTSNNMVTESRPTGVSSADS